MSNPFALLADEDSGDERSAAPQVAPKAAAAAAPTKSAAASAPNGNKKETTARGKPDYPQRGTGRKIYGGDSTTDRPDNELQKRTGNETRGGARGGSRGPRGGRGGRGAGGRVYDRHSQTGKTDSDKQEHQAWGGDEGKRELQNEIDGDRDAKADASGIATPVGDGAEAAPKTEGEDAAAAPAATPARIEEEEDNTKTYEQYLAERGDSSITGLQNLSIRKANEGADESQWKNAKVLSKEDEEDNYFGVNKEAKGRKRTQKEGKTYIEVEARFPRPGGESRGRGGRGRGGESRGRGGERGGRGRGGAPRGRGGNNATSNTAAPVDTSDASAFPSLS